jgi:hypothetical protein
MDNMALSLLSAGRFAGTFLLYRETASPTAVGPQCVVKLAEGSQRVLFNAANVCFGQKQTEQHHTVTSEKCHVPTSHHRQADDGLVIH